MELLRPAARLTTSCLRAAHISQFIGTFDLEFVDGSSWKVKRRRRQQQQQRQRRRSYKEEKKKKKQCCHKELRTRLASDKIIQLRRQSNYYGEKQFRARVRDEVEKLRNELDAAVQGAQIMAKCGQSMSNNIRNSHDTNRTRSRTYYLEHCADSRSMIVAIDLSGAASIHTNFLKYVGEVLRKVMRYFYQMLLNFYIEYLFDVNIHGVSARSQLAKLISESTAYIYTEERRIAAGSSYINSCTFRKCLAAAFLPRQQHEKEDSIASTGQLSLAPIAAEDKRCARSPSELGRNLRVPPRRIADCVILRSRDRCRIDTDRARELASALRLSAFQDKYEGCACWICTTFDDAAHILYVLCILRVSRHRTLAGRAVSWASRPASPAAESAPVDLSHLRTAAKREKKKAVKSLRA
ncbi:unnamed protein product [Trichogramma brassicae]|uniref:Uncharacterized protein n=1 Tax=Trichogramma brassicae TaxID=86971 RepID=A0A6H5J6H2_9HYME|nr:unnamed protein product [Trichogramma brassicae]